MLMSKIYTNPSIKGRLAFFLILAACIFTYAVYDSVHDSLHSSISRAENDFLYLRLHALRAIIQDEPNYIDIIRQDITWESQYTKFPEYYLRVIDPAGRVLLETPGMNREISEQRAAFPNIADPRKHRDVIWRSPNGRYFLLLADSVAVPHDSGKTLTLNIALDVTSPIIIDQANHKKIAAILIVNVLVFAGIILLIIQKGVKPLDDLVKIVNRITANNLAGSILITSQWPKEVHSLAISFNSMLERMEDALARLTHCASNMAHEIRTPINNFMGEAEIALSKERSPEEYRKVLTSGIEECERLSRLISSLLFLAHADNPSGSINRTFFDPLEVVEDILSFYGPQIDEKKAHITWYGNALLNGDPLLFHQAVSNLLMNALNYSSIGVKIDISIRENKERQMEVIVSDTGYGIEEKDLARIFDRFYRVDGAHSNHPQGSGLGLSIVRAIMDLHGGSISIKSSPGEGTAITLCFPPGDIPPGQRS